MNHDDLSNGAPDAPTQDERTEDMLSMSMFATRADYDEAVRAQHEQLTGEQLAVKLLAQIGNDDSDRAIAAVHDLAEAHAQRLTLQHHAADQVWRIADLEVKCVTLKELHDAATDERDALAQQHRSQHDADSAELRQLCADRDAARGERDALRVKVYDLERAAVKRREISDEVEAELVDECDTLRTLQIRAESERDALRDKYDELLVALHGIGAALGIPEGDRSPYSVTCGVLERVNRLAEIEAQEPLTDEQRAWARLGPLIEKHQIGISTPSNQVHRNGGPNAGCGKSGFWGGTAWMHGLERRPIAHGKSSALEAITELVAMIAAAPEHKA